MNKNDLAEMDKNLLPTSSYKNGIKIQELIHEFLDLNSISSGLSTMLCNCMGETLYEQRERSNQICRYSQGLNNLHAKKKLLLDEIKKNLEIVEREVILQEECLGNYMEEFKNSKKPEKIL
jgi:hypothetical protein